MPTIETLRKRVNSLEKRSAPRVRRRKDPKEEQRLERCRTDFHAFMEYCFTDTETGRPLKQGKIHRQWDAHIRKHDRAMIVAPREHGKTEQIPIGRALWELGRNPQLRIKIITQSDSTAVKRLTSIKGHIDRNPRVGEVFPDLRRHPDLDDWSKHTITVDRKGEDKDPSIEAVGVLSSGTGGRADRIYYDDLVDFRNAIAHPALRELVKDTFQDVWSNLLTKTGRAVYIATPWHEDDLTAALKGNSEWAVLEQPIGEDLIPIWKAGWTQERLAARRREIGDRAFARGFRLRPFSDKDQIFRAISRCLRPDLSIQDIDPRWPRFTGVDVGHAKRKAMTRSTTAQNKKPYTVIFTFALDPESRRWPLDIRRGHWSGPETANQVIDVNDQHHPEAIVVENNAYQNTLIDWIEQTSKDKSIPLQAFTTGANKADEMIGLPGLSAEFENLIWVIPTDGLEEDELGEEWPESWFAWIVEMKGYPAATLTDTIMACWFAREGVRRRLIEAASTGEDDEEVQKARREQEKEALLAELGGEEPEGEEWGWRDYAARGSRLGRGR